jgi:hypothetical protein
MRHNLKRTISEIDSALALGIAFAMSILGLFSATSSTLANNAILITLTVLALSIFRDRWRREDLSRKLDRILDKSGPVRMLSGREINQAFTEARRSTDLWVFKGGTGRYVRAVTFPECYRIARERHHDLEVRLEILDPTDSSVCERYAHFRRSMIAGADHTSEEWTTQRTQEELYATILAACWYRERFDQRNIRIGLTNIMSTFRYDMSEGSLIITQDDGNSSLFIPQDSSFYRRFKAELSRSLDQARQVPLERAGGILIAAVPTSNDASRVFEALDLSLDPTLDLDRIIQRALHAPNPYP